LHYFVFIHSSAAVGNPPMAAATYGKDGTSGRTRTATPVKATDFELFVPSFAVL
jgi:hypothetical protein